MADGNLIVTFDPSHLQSAKAEIEKIMKELKESAKILSSGDGLAEVSVKDARKIVQTLSKMKKDKFEYTYHWIPVDKWAKASIADMQKAIKELAKEIKDSDKWKMDIGRHKTKLEGKDLIMKLTAVIEKPKVDLENPDKIVKVEIIGNKAGISLLKKGELFNAALKK